jgi:hypothetical protein
VLLVSAFQPTTITLDPPVVQDLRRAAVVAALKRHLGYKLTLSLPVLLILGVVTAGLAPLLLLQWRFRAFARGETFQLEHAVECARVPVDEAGHSIPFAHLSIAVALVLTGIVLAIVQALVAPVNLFGLWSIWVFGGIPGYEASWSALYQLVLLAGYIALCEAARAHDRRVRPAYASLAVTDVEAPPQIDPEAVAALVLFFAACVAGCLWAAGMVLAGITHRRYINHTSRQRRGQLALLMEAMEA